MSPLLTTTGLARALDLAPSTIRHYRNQGRLTPASETPGGHARWDLDGARAQLGYPRVEAGTMTGLKAEAFAPAGQTVISTTTPSAPLPTEMVALGVREIDEPAGDAARHRWGGALLRRHSELAAR